MGSVISRTRFCSAHRIWRRHGLDDDAGFGRALAGVAGGAAHRRHPGHVAPLALRTADRRTQSCFSLQFNNVDSTMPTRSKMPQGLPICLVPLALQDN